MFISEEEYKKNRRTLINKKRTLEYQIQDLNDRQHQIEDRLKKIEMERRQNKKAQNELRDQLHKLDLEQKEIEEDQIFNENEIIFSSKKLDKLEDEIKLLDEEYNQGKDGGLQRANYI